MHQLALLLSDGPISCECPAEGSLHALFEVFQRLVEIGGEMNSARGDACFARPRGTFGSFDLRERKPLIRDQEFLARGQMVGELVQKR